MTAAVNSAALLLLLVLAAVPLCAGDLENRLELTLQRVLEGGPPQYTQEFLLADVIPQHTRQFTNFSGDLSGRYIGALSRISGQSGTNAGDAAKIEAQLAPLVAAVLRHQRADGHFGDAMGRTEISSDDMARLWGNGRLLIGLLEYYREEPQPQTLEAARWLGDFLISVAPKFNAPSVRRYFSTGQFAVGYICWTQNLEGLVQLYRDTGDERYLHLGAQLAERLERRPGQHSHGFLSTLRGVLQLSRVTGERRYLEQVEQEWRGIVDSGNLLVHGAIPEGFAPGDERDEGCSQADWLRLNLELWKETRDSKYLEQAERTLFNEFSFNQFGSGDFGHVNLRETGVGPTAVRAWWCCTMHGLRAFPEIFDSVFRFSGQTLFYDLPVDGEGMIEGLSVEADSSLEQDARIRMHVKTSDGEPSRIALRIPPWAGSVSVRIDDEILETGTKDGYAVVERPWQKGEVIEIEYELRTRLEDHPSLPGCTAVFHGPWLLAVAESTTPQFFEEAWEQSVVVLDDPRETDPLALTPLGKRAGSATPFEIPAAHHEFEWIPPGQPDRRKKGILRPLAEATASADSTRWEFWLRSAQPKTSPTAASPAAARGFDLVPLSLLVLAMALASTFLWRHFQRS